MKVRAAVCWEPQQPLAVDDIELSAAYEGVPEEDMA